MLFKKEYTARLPKLISVNNLHIWRKWCKHFQNEVNSPEYILFSVVLQPVFNLALGIALIVSPSHHRSNELSWTSRSVSTGNCSWNESKESYRSNLIRKKNIPWLLSDKLTWTTALTSDNKEYLLQIYCISTKSLQREHCVPEATNMRKQTLKNISHMETLILLLCKDFYFMLK